MWVIPYPTHHRIQDAAKSGSLYELLGAIDVRSGLLQFPIHLWNVLASNSARTLKAMPAACGNVRRYDYISCFA